MASQKRESAAHRIDGGDARSADQLGGPVGASNSVPSRPPQVTTIHAELIGERACTALGITAHGNAPALALCRRLIAIGYHPECVLQAYRADVLCLTVKSICAGAGLTVDESKCRVVPYEPVSSGDVAARIARGKPTASHVAKTIAGHP